MGNKGGHCMTAIRPEDVAEWHDEGRGDDGNLYFCIMLKDGRTVDLKVPYRKSAGMN